MSRRLVAVLAVWYPWRVDPSDETVSALRFLGWPNGYCRATNVISILLGAASLLVATLAGGLAPWAVSVAVSVSAATVVTTRAVPRVVACVVRRRTLGTAPWLVCRAAMRLRVTPTTEAAAAFAARNPEGVLDRSLAAAVRRAQGTASSGFDSFLDRWGDRLPPLRRGVRLLEAVPSTPAEERGMRIDRALDAVLDGTRERAAADAAGLRGPVTAVYAFGVLLPLALVAALPAARVAGLPISIPAVVLVYDVLLPCVLLAAAGWLVANRPITFPATRVPRGHPSVPDRRWPTLVTGAVVAGCAWVAAPILLAAWTAPVAAVGAGLGTALVVGLRPYRSVRERVRTIEDGLPDLLVGVGEKVGHGEPVETALPATARAVDSAAGDLFADAAARSSALGTGLASSLRSDDGPLEKCPSRRTRDAARLLAAATRAGRPSGPALVAAGEHLTDLARVEAETRRSVRDLTGTMSHTAALFGPLVGGITVALAGRVAGEGFGPGLPREPLALAVGGYVLVLAALLTAVATGLERDFDRALVGYRVGLALLSATTTYLAAVVVGGLVV